MDMRDLPMKLREQTFYYVVVDNDQPLSRWNTVEEARLCIKGFKEAAEREPHHFKKTYENIKGIRRVTTTVEWEEKR